MRLPLLLYCLLQCHLPAIPLFYVHDKMYSFELLSKCEHWYYWNVDL